MYSESHIPANEYPFACKFKQKLVSDDKDKSFYTVTYRNTFIEIAAVNNGPDVTSIHNFKSGDKAFLVWIEYSVGCSFGMELRKEALPVALLKDRLDAEKLIKKERFWSPSSTYDAKEHEEYKGAFFQAKDGQRVHFPHAPWTGYFNQVDEIHLEEVTIK